MCRSPIPKICPTIELTAHDLVYKVLAVCHCSIDEVKYSKKKKRNASKQENVELKFRAVGIELGWSGL